MLYGRAVPLGGLCQSLICLLEYVILHIYIDVRTSGPMVRRLVDWVRRLTADWSIWQYQGAKTHLTCPWYRRTGSLPTAYRTCPLSLLWASLKSTRLH